MASRNPVNLTAGLRAYASPDFVGQTVGEVMGDALVVDALSLSGNETARLVYENGDTEAVGNDYVLAGNDEISFSRRVGTKG